MDTDIKSTAAVTLFRFIDQNRTGWTLSKANEEKGWTEHVSKTVHHEGAQYTLKVYADGTVRIIERPYKYFKAIHGENSNPFNSSWYRSLVNYYSLEFDDLSQLIAKVKGMINNEHADDFLRVLRSMGNTNGMDYEQRMEREQAVEKAKRVEETLEQQRELDEAEDRIESRRGFWSRLFGG